MKPKDKIIRADDFLAQYCKKMCMGKCTGAAKEKCGIVKLLNEIEDASKKTGECVVNEKL